MINGAHAIIYTTDAEADRTFFRDILNLPSVDAGQGWLIFGLPPAEVAFHPAEANGRHELFLICTDAEALRGQLLREGVEVSAINDEGWGLVMHIVLPGGGQLGVYQPRHPRPPAPG